MTDFETFNKTWWGFGLTSLVQFLVTMFGVWGALYLQSKHEIKKEQIKKLNVLQLLSNDLYDFEKQIERHVEYCSSRNNNNTVIPAMKLGYVGQKVETQREILSEMTADKLEALRDAVQQLKSLSVMQADPLVMKLEEAKQIAVDAREAVLKEMGTELDKLKTWWFKVVQ